MKKEKPKKSPTKSPPKSSPLTKSNPVANDLPIPGTKIVYDAQIGCFAVPVAQQLQDSSDLASVQSDIPTCVKVIAVEQADSSPTRDEINSPTLELSVVDQTLRSSVEVSDDVTVSIDKRSSDLIVPRSRKMSLMVGRLGEEDLKKSRRGRRWIKLRLTNLVTRPSTFYLLPVSARSRSGASGSSRSDVQPDSSDVESPYMNGKSCLRLRQPFSFRDRASVGSLVGMETLDSFIDMQNPVRSLITFISLSPTLGSALNLKLVFRSCV
ncbi:hypothetical protein F2Q69_00062423 [Brassica cretica]|uniref:Uncharacterized protein n=1 Tax=Brassica cretica TaxID=69181 RepID=A0A8S9RGD4_BRACR|nr:hypothetical protein F2Q69_00062423 [Brassica cretica]